MVRGAPLMSNGLMTDEHPTTPPHLRPTWPSTNLSPGEQAILWIHAAAGLGFGVSAFFDVEEEWRVVGAIFLFLIASAWMGLLMVVGYAVRFVRPRWARMLVLLAGPPLVTGLFFVLDS